MVTLRLAQLTADDIADRIQAFNPTQLKRFHQALDALRDHSHEENIDIIVNWVDVLDEVARQ